MRRRHAKNVYRVRHGARCAGEAGAPWVNTEHDLFVVVRSREDGHAEVFGRYGSFRVRSTDLEMVEEVRGA